MIPRLKPIIGLQEFIAALHLPRSGDLEKFETAFAQLVGQRHAVAFPYGRTGLLFLLRALGLEGQEIICPAYTCVVVPHAIVYSGNFPVFIDCERGGFNMDLDLAEQAINEKTGAIIATSLFGYPVDLDKLDQIRNRHPKVYIIQDCAHSFSAEWKGRPVQREGIAALFGFNISKILTSVFGGMITTDNEKLYKKMRQLCKQELNSASWQKSFRRFLYFVAVYPTFYEPVYSLINLMERLGLLNEFVQYYSAGKINMPKDYLENMSRIEARVGMVNVKRYSEIISNRQSAAAYYFENMDKFKGILQNLNSSCSASELRGPNSLLLPPRVDGSTYSHFVILVSNREMWLQRGIKNGVQFGWIIEYNIPEMPSYGRHKPEEFPIAAGYSRAAVNLPVWGGSGIAVKVVKVIPEML